MRLEIYLQELQAKVEKWVQSINNGFYNFKDGYFQVPYLASDPETMIEGIKKSPFVRFDENYQTLKLNSPIIKFKQKYLNLEEGLWVLTNKIHWKVSVKTTAMLEEKPSQYYFLAYIRTNHPYKHLELGKNNDFVQPSTNNWTFYKSTTAHNGFFTKNTKFFSILF